MTRSWTPSTPGITLNRPKVLADRWGVRSDEVARTYPCDEFVEQPGMAAWRGVTVFAAADQLWPWVGQIRLAPYSYDWIDNLGRRSPRTLRGPADPTVGEHFSTGFGPPSGRILAVIPGEALTGYIAAPVMSYALSRKMTVSGSC